MLSATCKQAFSQACARKGHMKECQAHNTWFQTHCFKCTNAERSQIRAEQDHCQQPKNELAQGKEKLESFLSRVFQRKKDKKRDHESQSRRSSKISKQQDLTLPVELESWARDCSSLAIVLEDTVAAKSSSGRKPTPATPYGETTQTRPIAAHYDLTGVTTQKRTTPATVNRSASISP